jgi:hypothetical protein
MKYLFLVFITILVTSCKKYPIVFSENNNSFNYDLTLNENYTFRTISKDRSDSNSFKEKGVFTINDSILILDYTNKRIIHKFNVSAIINDTFLIIRYKEKILLYPFYRHQQDLTSKVMFMKKIVTDYTSGLLENYIGIDYLEFKQGNFEQIYRGKSLISPYYDRYISLGNESQN